MEVCDVLEGMLEVLQEKEWIQGNLYEYELPFGKNQLLGGMRMASIPVKGVCLEGACNLALFKWQRLAAEEQIGLKYFAGKAILAAAAELFPDTFQPDWMTALFHFNDAETTTREDVILAVKHAIEGLSDLCSDRVQLHGRRHVRVADRSWFVVAERTT